MRIEPATTSDCRAIADVQVRTWQQAYEAILPAEYLASLTVAGAEARWRELLADASVQVLVARGQTVVGFCAFGTSRDADAAPGWGEIYSIYVDPSVWAQGAGGLLCLEALERMRTSGLTTTTLWVFAENERARRFYRSLGFALEPGSEKEFALAGAHVRELRYLLPLA